MEKWVRQWEQMWKSDEEREQVHQMIIESISGVASQAKRTMTFDARERESERRNALTCDKLIVISFSHFATRFPSFCVQASRLDTL